MTIVRHTLLIVLLISFCCLTATRGEDFGYPSRAADHDALAESKELPPGNDQMPSCLKMIDSARLTGGLVVHVGGSEAEIAALSGIEGSVIHGLHRSPDVVAAARNALQPSGDYGRVSVEVYDGKRLPYADNLVNMLFVFERECPLQEAEILRALVPGGKAVVNGKVIQKAVPSEIDEWPQYLHDSGNNAVAEDKRIGHPRSLQWQASPDWTRHHHNLASVSSLVSAGGRVFYVVDEQSGHDMTLPGKWTLAARDAFNGLLLWKQPIKTWLSSRNRFRSGPMQVARTLAATKDHVYSMSQLDGPVVQLDASTGSLLQSFDGTDNAEEFVLDGDRLFVLIAEGESELAQRISKHLLIHPNEKRLLSIDTQSGKTVWSWKANRIEDTPIPQTLAVAGDRVFLAGDENVFCLDRSSGRVLWKSEPKDNIVEYPWYPQKKIGSHAGRRAGWSVATLVAKNDIVIFSNGHRVDRLDYETGKSLWQAKGQAGCLAPIDIFIVGDYVWIGNQPLLLAEGGYGKYQVDTGEKDGEELDDLTRFRSMGHHHRCYRDKATTEFIIDNYRGIEMLDLDGQDHSRNNWTRGLCQYGVMPANGLIYVPPHGCGCYPEAKLTGFLALGSTSPRSAETSVKDRLEKGPAFGKAQATKTSASDWPTLRGNMKRSGSTSQQLAGTLTSEWSLKLGRQLTAPVVAADLVLVADKEAHTVHAIKMLTGDLVWSFTAGGRIDSPPTLYEGMAVFGCRDGRIYCLRLSDGELAWKFLAAPSDHRTCVRGQLESLWPLYGSVLIKDNLVYAAAGRNTYLDGGMELYTLNAETGEVVNHRSLASEAPRILTAEEDRELNEKHPVTGMGQNNIDYKTSLAADQSDAFSIKGGTLNDLLSSDGEHVFLHFTTFNKQWEQQEERGLHLYSTSSLLDDRENQSSHWFLGYGNFQKMGVSYHWSVNRSSSQMLTPVGTMLAFDSQSAWSVMPTKDHQYQLFESQLVEPEGPTPPVNDFKTTKEKRHEWNVIVNMRPRAMVKAGRQVFLLGAPEKGADLKSSTGVVHSFLTGSGEPALTIKLPAVPVWDGVAVSQGKMFISLEDGSLRCLGN